MTTRPQVLRKDAVIEALNAMRNDPMLKAHLEASRFWPALRAGARAAARVA